MEQQYDTWQLFRNKEYNNHSITDWHDFLVQMMNKVLPIHEIIDNVSIDNVPSHILEKKKNRLRWKWSTIKDYNSNVALPVMTAYKKSFPRLSHEQYNKLYKEAVRATGIKDLSSFDDKTLYYIAKPFIITEDMIKNYIVSKFNLNRREQSHILPCITISSPSSDKSAVLFFNFDIVRMIRLMYWLDSDELRYKPGGIGYKQVQHDFVVRKNHLLADKSHP